MEFIDKHPYLYISKFNLKEKAITNHAQFNKLLEKANVDLLLPPLIPEDPKGWLYDILDRTKERILRGCIVYKVTKEEKYFNCMKEQLFCLIDEWPWIEKFHKDKLNLNADLRTGIIMFTLGLVYDWMYNDFTDFERGKVYKAIAVKGFNLLKKDIKKNAFYLTSYRNNWLAIMLGGYCIAALATYNENRFSKIIYDMAMEKTKIMANNIGKDGAWEEGPFYWGGISFLIMFFDIISSIDFVPNFLNMKSIKNTPLFPIYMNMPPSGRANFSDAHYHQDHNSIYILATIARITKNPHYQWAFHEFNEVAKESHSQLKKLNITQFRPQEETYQFLTYDSTLSPKYPYTYEPFKVFKSPTYGFISSRTNFGRNDDKTVMCVNAGTNGTNHHQLDIGQIIITSNKENIIVDTGYGMAYYFKDKTKTTIQNYFAKNSFGHNIVTIGNKNQTDSSSAYGKITEAYRKDHANYFTIDLTNAYENTKKAIRKIIHKDNIIMVIDDFILLEPDSAKLRWFFNGDLLLANNKFIITNKNTLLEGNVSTSLDTSFSCSSAFFSDEGCIDRANKKLPETHYPYMQFYSPSSIHHVFHTTFYIKKRQ